MQKKEILSNKIADSIRNMIIKNKLKPKEKLPNEIDLSTELNVSRSTIREAVKCLVSENILEIRRGKGTYVCETPGIAKDPFGVKFMDDDDILLNLFEIRLMIEPEIAALAAERINNTQISELRKTFSKLKEDIETGKDHTYSDRKAHTIIANCTNNPIIDRLMPIINDSIIEAYKKLKDVPDSGQFTIEHHEALIDAICNKKAEESRIEMKGIIVYVINNIKKQMVPSKKI